MLITFNRVARGPAWERWIILEDQLGDTGIAGEVVMTFRDANADADVDCTVLFSRELTDDDLDQLLAGVSSILSGEGNVTVYTAREIFCREFSLQAEDQTDRE